MRKWGIAAGLSVVAVAAVLIAFRILEPSRVEQQRFDAEESELVVANQAGAIVSLFKAGRDLQTAVEVRPFDGNSIWLPPGNYFLKAYEQGRSLYYPVPMLRYRGGPDANGSYQVTIRSLRPETPPRSDSGLTDYSYIPAGHFLFGDRLNPQDPHYVWLRGYFISLFETTNREFKQFLDDPAGYADDANWPESGKVWKAHKRSRATALMRPGDAEFERFGQADQPVTMVNWYEATAFCRWLTRKMGNNKWIFALPSEAEWEKAARGPDSFEYALGATVSDSEVSLYNWKKNPTGTPITVVGSQSTPMQYSPNRCGLYHMTGNVSEWTGSVYRSYNRQHPYQDDDQSGDDAPGPRVVRGGSWYTASVAVLRIAYRESLQPEVSATYLGFRIAVRTLP